MNTEFNYDLTRLKSALASIMHTMPSNCNFEEFQEWITSKITKENMIESKTLTYYNWIDIQTFLCNALGVEYNYFFTYHAIIGGDDTKNFWNKWVKLAPVNFGEYNLTNLREIEDEIIRAAGELNHWSLDLIPALQKLRSEIGDKISIYYDF